MNELVLQYEQPSDLVDAIVGVLDVARGSRNLTELEAAIDHLADFLTSPEPELFWSEDADTEGHWHNAEGQDVDENGVLL